MHDSNLHEFQIIEIDLFDYYLYEQYPHDTMSREITNYKRFPVVNLTLTHPLTQILHSLFISRWVLKANGKRLSDSRVPFLIVNSNNVEFWWFMLWNIFESYE